MRNYREATQIHIKVLLQCQVYIYSTSTANNTHKNKNSVIAFFFSEVDPPPPSLAEKNKLNYSLSTARFISDCFYNLPK